MIKKYILNLAVNYDTSFQMINAHVYITHKLNDNHIKH